MAFKSVQLTLSTTAQAAIVKGSSAGQFVIGLTNSGLQDPLPVSIKNEDAAIVIYWGGPGVTSTTGQSIAAGSEIIMNLYGQLEVPYLVAASGTPVASVVLGRQ